MGDLESYITEHTEPTVFKRNESWVILSPIERSIKEKIERVGVPLKDWDIKINRGILTGCNEAFIINEEKRQEILNSCKTEDERERTDKIIRPILRGRDIKRNGYKWAGLYVIATHNGYKSESGKVKRIDINDFPTLKEWFDHGDWNDKPEKGINYERLSKRTDKGDTPYNLRDCAYMDDFSKQKIIYGQFRRGEYCLDNNGMLLRSNEYFIVSYSHNIKSLLVFLNSEICYFYQRITMNALGGDTTIAQKSIFLNIPVPQIDNIDATLSDFYKELNFTSEERKLISTSVNP